MTVLTRPPGSGGARPGTPGAGPSAPPSGLPDVNVETHPFENVRQALDRVAYLGLYAIPRVPLEDPWLTPSDRTDYFGLNAGYGLDIRCDLNRFDARIDGGDGMRVSQTVGGRVGTFRSKFLFSDGLPEWRPGIEPATLYLDAWRREYFSMLDAEVSFSTGDDVLEGYGIGRTFPILVHGRPTLSACAVGTFTGGRGGVRGFTGTFVLNGVITSDLGFQGSFSCRIPDPNGDFPRRAAGPGGPAPGAAGAGDVDPDVQDRLRVHDPATYVCLRGEKAGPEVRTEYGPPPGDGLVSLVTPALMKVVRFEPAAGASSGLPCRLVAGPTVAELLADVELDIMAPPGTVESPNSFTTRNVYDFTAHGGPGCITADVEVGRSFDLELPGLPGQAAMRYGGFGLLLDGSGPFAGVRGTLAVNSAIGVAPHALSMLNVLRIVDPDGALQGRRPGGGPSRDRGPAEGRWSHLIPTASQVHYMFEASPDGGQERAETTDASRPAGGAGGLPDLNAETNPFPEVQAALDRTVFLSALATPVAVMPLPAGSGGIGGIAMTTQLHRLAVDLDRLGPGAVSARNVAGEPVAALSHRWLFMPDDYAAAPGAVPPPTALDPGRVQRFTMLDQECRFGSGEDGFRGFGVGETVPVRIGGETVLLVGAVGDLLDGWGRLAGAVGTYVLGGRVSPERGFEGHLVVRVANPDSVLRASSVPEVVPVHGGVPGMTFLLLRGQKASPDDRTELVMGSDGQPRGFALQQELRDARLRFAVAGGLRAEVSFGRVVGSMRSEVHLDLSDVGAPTASSAPIPFSSRNRFTLTDPAGREVGSFVAEGGEGRTFDLALPGLPDQKALRFGAFQRLDQGTGAFAGITGILTDNSAVGVAPHATATLYSLCIADPHGKYRAALDGRGDQ